MQVINVRGLAPNDPSVVYCGRACYGWTGSVLANPYVLSREEDREEILKHYALWLWGRVYFDDREVIAALDAIPEGAKLGCWCWPRRCHAEIIIQVARKLREAGP